MNAIDQQAASFLLNHHPGRVSANTVITVGEDGLACMFLHGHPVAVLHPNGHLTLCDCGYQTATTKARLNGVLFMLGTDYRIVQKKKVWWLVSIQHEYTEWNGVFRVQT